MARDVRAEASLVASPHPLPMAEAGSDAGSAVRRVAVRAVAAIALLLALPLMALVALLVRTTSMGAVLVREPGYDRRGHHVDLLRFRTTLEGASTRTHERLREVVGAGSAVPLTGPGRFLAASRLDRLPRLLNVAAGHSSTRG